MWEVSKMVKRIGASEARTQLSKIMMDAHLNGNLFVIERNKTPLVVVIGYQDYLQIIGSCILILLNNLLL